MAIEEDFQVRIGEHGVNVFRVVQLGVDGNPNLALVEAVDEPKPGVYQWIADVRRLVPAEG